MEASSEAGGDKERGDLMPCLVRDPCPGLDTEVLRSSQSASSSLVSQQATLAD